MFFAPINLLSQGLFKYAGKPTFLFLLREKMRLFPVDKKKNITDIIPLIKKGGTEKRRN